MMSTKVEKKQPLRWARNLPVKKEERSLEEQAEARTRKLGLMEKIRAARQREMEIAAYNEPLGFSVVCADGITRDILVSQAVLDQLHVIYTRNPRWSL